MSDVIPTIDVMPMTMPSTVRPDRILLVRSVSTDITKISLNSPQRMLLFLPKSFDGVKRGGAHGRVETKRQAHHGGDRYPEDDRP